MTTALSEPRKSSTGSQALVYFSIGPVQEFIKAARSTRDLWTGSYLLSWLTAHALAALERSGGRIIVPDVAGNPLYEAATGQPGRGEERMLRPCLPNFFLAEAPEDEAEELAEKARQAAAEEWHEIAAAVHGQLAVKWDRLAEGWDHRWQEQVSDYWDLRVTLLPAAMNEVETLQQLTGWSDQQDVSRLRRELLGRLHAANKVIRHYPQHEVDPGNGPGDVRPKCALLGSLAQMGPLSEGLNSPMEVSARFWEQAAGEATNIAGTRLGSRDRLCAVSLVKRYCWSAYFCGRLGFEDPRAARFDDVQTVAASDWLARAAEEEHGTRWPRLARLGSPQARRRETWSGSWLRWKTREEGRLEQTGDREECPDAALWEETEAARRSQSLGTAPPYYAVLMLDGDKMGDRMRQADAKELAETSRILAGFAQERVPELVEHHEGTLVYAGGDDVLALLSTRRALQAAQELAGAFRNLEIPAAESQPLTCSGSLVVAHVHDNLRDVLEATRTAERQAKDAGRDCLALVVRRRSGEHSTAIVPWTFVETVIGWVSSFEGGASDRWAYQLVRDLPTLRGLPDDAIRSLLRRQVQRSDRDSQKKFLAGADGSAGEMIARAFDEYAQLRNGGSGRDRITEFLTLLQSASFLARGRE